MYGVTLLLMSVGPLANMIVWFNAHHDVHPPTARQLRWELMWRIMRWQNHTCKVSIPESFRSSSCGTLSDHSSYDGPNRQAYFLYICSPLRKQPQDIRLLPFYGTTFNKIQYINKFNINVSTLLSSSTLTGFKMFGFVWALFLKLSKK